MERTSSGTMTVSLASNLPLPSAAKTSCRAGMHLSVDGSLLAVSETMMIDARRSLLSMLSGPSPSAANEGLTFEALLRLWNEKR